MADGGLVAVEGVGCLAAVGVGAAEEVVGLELLVGGAVAVELVGDGLRLGGVAGGEHGVVAVPLRHLRQACLHVIPLLPAHAGGKQEHCNDRY